VLEIRKKHGSVPKIHTCSGPDSHNEQTPALKVPLKRNSGSVPAGMNNLHTGEPVKPKIWYEKNIYHEIIK
jgi:hypothetical protein